MLLVILATFLPGAVLAASDGAPGTEQHVVLDENQIDVELYAKTGRCLGPLSVRHGTVEDILARSTDTFMERSGHLVSTVIV